MAFPGTYELSHPSAVGQRVDFLNPAGPYATGHFSLPLGDPGGLGATQGDDEGRHANSGVQDTNGRVTYAFFINNLFWKDHHSGANQYTFVSAVADSKQRISASHRMLSVSMLNFMLKEDALFIKQYDSPTCEKLVREWRPLGVQLNEDANRVDQFVDHKQVFSISGRARMVNYWQAVMTFAKHKNGVSVRPLDELYFLLVRRKFTANEMANGYRLASKHYWQYVPYISQNRQKPDPCLYNGSDVFDSEGNVTEVGWNGHFVSVGVVQSLFGAAKMAEHGLHVAARDVMHPTQDSNQYKYLINEISELEVMLH